MFNEVREIMKKSYNNQYMPICLLVAFVILSIIVLREAWQVRKELPQYVGRKLTQTEMSEVIERNSSLISYVHLTENADFPR